MTGVIISLVILAVIAGTIAYGITTLIENSKTKQKTLEKIARELEELKKRNTPE